MAALDSSVLSIHVVLAAISNRSDGAFCHIVASLVINIVIVDIDFIAPLRSVWFTFPLIDHLVIFVGHRCEVTATFCAAYHAARLLLLIFVLTIPTNAAISDRFTLAAGYDFSETKVACVFHNIVFSLLILFIGKALLVEFGVVGFSLCLRSFMKLIGKLKVLYRDSLGSFVLLRARWWSILLRILFNFLVILIIRLLWRWTEITRLRDRTDRQTILFDSLALLVFDMLGGALLGRRQVQRPSFNMIFFVLVITNSLNWHAFLSRLWRLLSSLVLALMLLL